MGRYDGLYQPITDQERIRLIADFEIERVMTAPGHRDLRHPEAIEPLVAKIAGGELGEVLGEEIRLGIFASDRSGEVELLNVECLDGNHRLLAGLESGVWRTIGDVPIGAWVTRVNGWRASPGTGEEERWVPLPVAEQSDIAGWKQVHDEKAKGDTARIPGHISSISPLIKPEHWGITFSQLWSEWRSWRAARDALAQATPGEASTPYAGST
jgi:hypothetical protein